MSTFKLPDDLSKLTAAELAQLKADARAASNAILDKDPVKTPWTMDEAAQLKTYANAIQALTKAETTLAETAAKIEADVTASREAIDAIFATTTPETDAGDDTDGDTTTDTSADKKAEEITPELVTASTVRDKTPVENVIKKPTLNVKLRQLAENSDTPRRRSQGPIGELDITVAANVPTLNEGGKYPDLMALANAFHEMAANSGVTHGAPNYRPVAKVRNHFDKFIAANMAPNEVEKVFRELSDPAQLYATVNDRGDITTAGGGFCAPSVNRYDFFNVTCEDGEIDLPTFGAERGGINFPVSPSFADVFTGEFTSGTNPWLWTETDDIATVTGSPNKPCVRVTCPSFTNVRLECYGICLTAGNLTDWAYPEATRNHITLLMSALFRAKNMRYIQQIQSLASTTVTGGAAGAGVIAPTLGMLELQAKDYRTRYGMCNSDVVEAILPYWILGAMRSDAAKRPGVSDLFCLPNSQLADWFDCRNIRAQFVSDYQVRGSGQIGAATPANAWPTTVEAMMWAPGTVQRGNGLQLNLGVVRDSVLNAENDHTAVWAEECHLIARFGHEIRRMSIPICTDGTTGASDLTACGL